MADTERDTSASINDPAPVVDYSRTVFLTDHLTAIVAIGPDGAETFWLLDEHHSQDVPPMAVTEHEQTGRLPKRYRYALNPCSATTKVGARRGKPCGNPALDGTDRCARHPHDTAGSHP